jgi:hypothetical protein
VYLCLDNEPSTTIIFLKTSVSSVSFCKALSDRWLEETDEEQMEQMCHRRGNI